MNKSIFLKAISFIVLPHVGVGLQINTSSSTSRRAVLSTISTLASVPLVPQSSGAAVPLTAQDADNFAAKLDRKLRKPPPKILRQNLNLDFAVLLMRSSYNAVDELDFVAMDQFQKDFFLIRQAEYLPYVNELGPGLVKQGELVDPYYFDFISFAQYATIFRDITIDPAVVFEEQQPIIVGEGEDEHQEFIAKVIKRDPSIENSMLKNKHDEMVGTKILDKLNETFGQTKAAIPFIAEGSRPDSTKLLVALQQLVNLFVISGFAFDGKVVLKKEPKSTDTGSGSQFEITFNAPANLWSGQALAAKKANPTNDFLLKTAKILMKRAGYKVSSTSLTYTSTQEISTISIA
jgi:hypothetical protein